MILPKHNKIEECCAHPKMGRAQLESPFIDGKNIVATDGRVMAVVPVTREEGDADLCRVPIAAIKAARKLPNPSVACGAAFKLSNGMTFPADPDAGQLPAYKHAISEASATYRTMINADSLSRVCAALGAEQVILEFTAEGGEPGVVRVIPAKGDARGYMMTGRHTPPATQAEARP